MPDPSSSTPLAQYGAIGFFCAVLMAVVVYLWRWGVGLQKELQAKIETTQKELQAKVDTANEQRIKDAQTYAELVSKKDAEKSAEKDARINDAVVYAKVHNDSTGRAYEFRHSFEELSNHFVDLQDLIQKFFQSADDKERDAREQRERDLRAENEKLKTTARIPAYSLPGPRKKAPSSHDPDE